MKRYVCLILILSLFSLNYAYANQGTHIKASHAWIRLLPANLPASGYVNLQNDSSSVAVLIGAHSSVYKSIMLHQSTNEHNGINTMLAVERLPIASYSKLALAPASYHLMLEQANRSLQPGDRVDINLDFADGSHLAVPFLVQPANTVNPK